MKAKKSNDAKFYCKDGPLEKLSDASFIKEINKTIAKDYKKGLYKRDDGITLFFSLDPDDCYIQQVGGIPGNNSHPK